MYIHLYHQEIGDPIPLWIAILHKKSKRFLRKSLAFCFSRIENFGADRSVDFLSAAWLSVYGLSLDCGKKKADASVVYKTIEKRSAALPEHPRRQYKNPGGKAPLRVFAQKRGKKGVIEPLDWAASGQCPGTR